MLQLKDTEWQARYRAKIHWCAIFRRPISHAKTHIDSKQMDGRRFTKHMESKTNKQTKKAGVAILVSDKTDFKPTKI